MKIKKNIIQNNKLIGEIVCDINSCISLLFELAIIDATLTMLACFNIYMQYRLMIL